ncbi:MAG TPA: hypothetical protein VFP72_14480 [Kineosporiaceae bacterium]|nr:hypothetical protein [Kineosporiaceae bacterium]
MADSGREHRTVGGTPQPPYAGNGTPQRLVGSLIVWEETTHGDHCFAPMPPTATTPAQAAARAHIRESRWTLRHGPSTPNREILNARLDQLARNLTDRIDSGHRELDPT